MNILFLSQIVPYPPHGGVLQRGYNIIRELHKLGRVHLLAFLHPDTLTTPSMISESREVLSRYCATVEYFPLWPKRSKSALRLAYLAGAVWPEPFSVLAHRSSAFRTRISKLIATGNLDIVHFDTIALAQYLPEQLPCASVVTHHNIESMLMARRSAAEKGYAARFYTRQQARKLESYEADHSPRFDMNIMMSSLDEAALRHLAPDIRTAVVPNGVDVEYFVPRPDEERPVMIYTGGMNMFANRDAVLYFLHEIWPMIRKQIPDAQFFAVGQDPPPELCALATANSGIVVTGYVDDVRPFIAQAGVYVVPLRVGGGTRLKVVDAMAQGKAIVSTSLGCEGIDVIPDKTIMIADDPQEFAERVVYLLRNPSDRARLGQAAREMAVTRYAWPMVGERLFAAYRQAIAHYRSRQPL